MNDDATLYLAVRVSNSSFDTGGATFQFNNDHDDVLLEDGDDQLSLSNSASVGVRFEDRFVTDPPPCFCRRAPVGALPDAYVGGLVEGPEW